MTIVQFPALRRFWLRFQSVVFHSKFHTSGAIVARIAVCAATLIWAGMVLIDGGALERELYGSILGHVASPWVYGAVLGVIALTLLARLWFDCTPHWIGVVGYGLILFAWLFVAAFLIITQRPPLLTVSALVVVIAGVALYAFLASPIPANESRC